jgi:hypothetical protein
MFYNIGLWSQFYETFYGCNLLNVPSKLVFVDKPASLLWTLKSFVTFVAGLESQRKISAEIGIKKSDRDEKQRKAERIMSR